MYYMANWQDDSSGKHRATHTSGQSLVINYPGRLVVLLHTSCSSSIAFLDAAFEALNQTFSQQLAPKTCHAHSASGSALRDISDVRLTACYSSNGRATDMSRNRRSEAATPTSPVARTPSCGSKLGSPLIALPMQARQRRQWGASSLLRLPHRPHKQSQGAPQN